MVWEFELDWARDMAKHQDCVDEDATAHGCLDEDGTDAGTAVGTFSDSKTTTVS